MKDSDEAHIRRMLASQEFLVGGIAYGVALWHVTRVADGDGAGPILHLDLTAAPLVPSDALFAFGLQMARDDARNPQMLIAAIDAQLRMRVTH